ncbi:ZIP family metal transporter [Patescibacteria group bacterium]|nr:ZIP family metal transporter [Patescibacteria group bacterium]
MLLNIILATFLASIVSLFLVSILLLHKDLIKSISFPLVAFAAGTLLAIGFLETMREAVELGGEQVYLWVTLSIAGFFILERVFLFLHHHEHEEKEEEKEHLKMPTSFLLFGDGLHNFLDGISIAAAFLVNFQLGIVTTIAVFVHEIPHELADFSILVHKGWEKKKVIFLNLLSGITALAGAVLAYYLGNSFHDIVPFLLAVTTGNFIYLAATDLLPEIHHKADKDLAINYSVFFVLGILLIYILVKLLG